MWTENPGQQRVAKNLPFIPLRMTIIPKQTNKQKPQKKTSGGEDVEKLEPFCTAGGNVK